MRSKGFLKRRAGGLSWLIAVLLLAVACGDPVPQAAQGGAAAGDDGAAGSEGASETLGEPGAEVTLDFLWFTDGPDLEAIQKIVADFAEERDDIAVNFLNIPYEDLNQRLQAQLAANDPPDLARITDVGVFRNNLLDISGHLSDPQAFADAILEQPMAHVMGDNGEIYGLPHDFTMNGPLVNVDMFKEAGIEIPGADDEPWTWDELVENAVAAQEAGGAPYALAFDRSGHRFATMLSQFGGSYFSEDGAVAFSGDGAEQAVAEFVRLHDEGLMPLDVWLGSGDSYADAADFFISGQAPVYFAGNWVVAHLDDTIDDFEWTAMPNPCDENCGGFPGGKFVVPFDGTEHPEEAAALIEHLADPEVMREFASQSMFLPTRNDLIEEGVDYPTRQKEMDVFLADIPRLPDAAYNDQYHSAFGPVAGEAANNITRALAGQIDPATVLADTQKEGQRLVDEMQ